MLSRLIDHTESKVDLPCISAAKIQLLFCYLVMVTLNGYAIAKYERGATDGYAMSYVQPDAQTFGIWGLIYALLIPLCFNADRIVPEARLKISFAFLLNGLWLIVNGLAVHDGWSYWAAVSVLVLYAGSLWSAYSILAVDYKWSTKVHKTVVYTPLSLNLAWVTLAAILNFSNTAMNDKLDFSKKENRTAIGGPDWAMGVLALAALIAGYLAFHKSDVVYAAGTVWAFQGIVRHQTDKSGFHHPISAKLHDLAHILSVALVVLGSVGFVRILFAKPYKAARRPNSPSREAENVMRELKERYIPLSE